MPLDDLIELRYGKALVAGDRVAGDYPVIGSGGVAGTHTTALVTMATIVVGRKGSIGSLTWAPDGCWPIDTAYYVAPKRDVDMRWLYWSLHSLGLDRMNKSAAVPGLNREDAYRASLPLPPLPEQRRIAAILDEADALRAKRRRTTALLNDIPAVVFDSYDKSRWDVATLADVARLQGGITLNARRGALPAKANYLRVANVFRGSIDLSELKETGVTDREIARTRLQVDDVLVVEGHGNRAEVGRAALIETPPDGELTHQNHLFRLRPITGRVTGRVLELALNCATSREYFRRVANTTSGLNTLNATNVRALSLRVPPIGMQQAIAADVERARSARGSAQQHESHLDGLFASLQHRAFRGEL
ncbi:restriction endonuclease subunit S [Microbacterium limosum]|uniref:Restriction endonuclease subunit S n=1 Tax=Microbacterium limosum TaxID=3079935 RepID=A0AAU0MJ02_9MICO|nr:restriction endonuclease subunit S [Microbacterium sp. Y20]WOQ70134.1 restriction endonuclease subunit S [Microbacterium sp. Y20]